MPEAIRLVNENLDLSAATLRATGFVDGRFLLPDGRHASYHLDGTLFYLPPRCVRFDLRSFGDQKFLLGSNDEYFWYYEQQSGEFRCGRHGEGGDAETDIPIPPEQIVDAIGMTPIPASSEPADPAQRIQRVEPEYQQILFLELDEHTGVRLQKEYWLDRYWPRLIRRVVFRDVDGVVELESALDAYKPLGRGGPLLPHVMTATWPKKEAYLRFRITRWKSFPDVGPTGAQFAPPPQCMP